MAASPMPEIDEAALASELIEALDGASFVPPPTQRFADLDFACAYRVAAESARLRRARGEQPALIVGEPREITASDIPTLVAALRDCRVTLLRDGLLADSGVGANALGHPALALARLADVIASQPEAAPLATGEIITTGTLAVAQTITPGEIWRTETDGLALPPLTLRVV